MHVEKQGANECMLATLAALGGATLDTMRAMVRQHAGLSWDEIWMTDAEPERHNLFWGTVTALCIALGLPPIPRVLGPPPTGYALPPRGRGHLRVGSAFGNHIMPWENGLLYDPHHPEDGVTLAQWLVSCPGWWVTRITTVSDGP